MKSRVYRFRAVWMYCRDIVGLITDDKITIYAAQASFFVIISAVPFLSLLISIIGIVAPAEVPDFFGNLPVSDSFADILNTILTELKTAPNVSLLSVSAVTTLWSASKGITAIRGGIEKVYHAKRGKNIVSRRIKSLVITLVFIALIVAVVVLLLFGDFISDQLSIIHISDIVLRMRAPFFVLFMCIIFTATYAFTAKRSEFVKGGILPHIPGAVFSSVGWVAFSYFYSLYINHFPNASYIYGSLAAVCLIMLWLYFCMIILLLGAEVNKIYFAGKPHDATASEGENSRSE